jgi:RimJ/RimL family protein N-acetyltransferase
MLDLVEITPAILRAWARSLEEVQALLGAELLPGSLLPPDFVAGFLDSALDRNPWLGVIALLHGKVAGAGAFTCAPKDGAVEIGYGVSPVVEGKGVATAIATRLWELACRNGAARVIACTLPDHFASQRVLIKAGFHRIEDLVRKENLGPPEDPGPEVETLLWQFERPTS